MEEPEASSSTPASGTVALSAVTESAERQQQHQQSIKRKRTSVACRRCRRLRKSRFRLLFARYNRLTLVHIPKECINEGTAPCASCLEHSPVAANECSLPPRGQSKKDREVSFWKQPALSEQSLTWYNWTLLLTCQFRRVRAPSLTGSGATSDNLNIQHAADSTIINSNGIPDRNIQTTASPSQTSAYSESEAAENSVYKRAVRYTSSHGPATCTLESLPPLEEIVDGIKACFTSFFQVGFLHASSFVERITVDVESVNLLLVLALLAMGAPFTPALVRRFGGKVEAGERRALALFLSS